MIFCQKKQKLLNKKLLSGSIDAGNLRQIFFDNQFRVIAPAPLNPLVPYGLRLPYFIRAVALF